MEQNTFTYIVVAIVLVLGVLVLLKLAAPHMGIVFSVPYLDPVLLAIIRALKSLAAWTARLSPI